MSLPRQLTGFLVSGVLATASDAIAYAAALATPAPAALAALLHVAPHDVAKGASFLVGTFVSFELNRRLTFGRPTREARQAGAFFALYGLTFLLNVGANHLLLDLLTPVLPGLAPTLAFVLATGCSMVANFLGQRLWVFRHG
jgi:putative flippase GtrA